MVTTVKEPNLKLDKVMKARVKAVIRKALEKDANASGDKLADIVQRKLDIPMKPLTALNYRKRVRAEMENGGGSLEAERADIGDEKFDSVEEHEEAATEEAVPLYQIYQLEDAMVQVHINVQLPERAGHKLIGEVAAALLGVSHYAEESADATQS